jgi:hypothetical protein
VSILDIGRECKGVDIPGSRSSGGHVTPHIIKLIQKVHLQSNRDEYPEIIGPITGPTFITYDRINTSMKINKCSPHCKKYSNCSPTSKLVVVDVRKHSSRNGVGSRCRYPYQQAKH